MIIFEKEYDGESIVDIESDIYDAINAKVETDEHGIPKGTFMVVIQWRDYE